MTINAIKLRLYFAFPLIKNTKRKRQIKERKKIEKIEKEKRKDCGSICLLIERKITSTS